MTSTTSDLERAFASTRAVLANLGPDDMTRSTPCRSWQVRDAVNHLVAGSGWFGEAVEAGTAPAPAEADHAAGDFLAAFDRGAARTVAAFGAPGALEKELKLPFGVLPGAAFMRIATTDTFTHGWDVAVATGQSTDLDPELAARLLEGARAFVQPAFRGDDGVAPFGPEQEAPAGATNADALAAFLGRRVGAR